jgi:mannose-1-phosphate guanylyltransferase
MYCVVICGGSGSRLWPYSRQEHPKPFLALPSGHSLIQEAFLRAAALPQCREIITVTNRKLNFKAVEALKSLGLGLPASFILEPFGRNTAPAITVAALDAMARGGDQAELLILAADHLISDQGAFAKAVGEALELARRNLLVTFGVAPTRPETGFGYIEAEGAKVLRFVEKPDEAAARAYLESGRFFWNSGLFCLRAGALLAEMAALAPEVLKYSEAALAGATAADADERVLELDPGPFATAPDISIDYAVMEKSSLVAMVPCDIGWNDIGTWRAMAELAPADDRGNHVLGDSRTHLEDVTGCDIASEGRLVAALGVENLLVVDTPDALLVAAKDRVQDVRRVFERLKESGEEAVARHRTVYRPWGSFTLLGEGPRFKIKMLAIKPGGVLSLQRHQHRSEHWVVVSGMAEVTNGDRVFFLDTNESTYIKAGHDHRVANRGIIELVIIEVQSGDYLGEDDIVRLDDIYNRTSSS